MFKRSQYDYAVIVLMISWGAGLPLGWYCHEQYQDWKFEQVSSQGGCDDVDSVCA